jgi:ABC-type sugar transport system permease subunit
MDTTTAYTTSTTTLPQRVRPRKSFRQILRANTGFLFILPALLIFLVFGLYTVIYSVILSFHRWNGFGTFSIFPMICERPECEYVGLENFQQFLYADPTQSFLFWRAFQNNIAIAVFVTIGTILIALPIAMLLNRALRGQAVFRTVMLLPMVTAGIAVFYVWSYIYQPAGALNTIARSLGLDFLVARQGWLGQPNTALLALMIVMVWSAVPSALILYLAGLQGIDREMIEAAVIDGANAWQIFWRITWPLLLPITVIIVITSVNGALQGYEMVYLMTNGAPAGHTAVVGLQIFNYGFGDQRQLGMASAMSWSLFVVVFLLALLNLRLFRSRTQV